MLGDTAVAVHPDDERYQDLIGKTVILPIMNKEIPIIADKFVEKEFGTGCVKVTPAHDPNDYQAGLEHNLEVVEVFDDHAIMKDLMPEVKGMLAQDARKVIVKRLEELGALVKTEDYTHSVAKCERCKTTIEPRISEQWFVKMKEITEPAIQVVKDDIVKFIPKKYEKTYFNWTENIRDWCISRQLWWGHRIPAYYCDDCNHITVTKEDQKVCETCGSENIKRDEDTLDTWFSSALWPFSTLGWPNEDSEDLKTFFPTNVLVTGYDIITFWVSRMVTSSMYLLKERPFKDVLIHGIVRDSQGRKMSKTLGNGVDPLDVIEEYGADALRFSLISGTTMGNDIKYMPEKLDQAANFANKIWNAARFVTSNMVEKEELEEFAKKEEKDLRLEDKWILAKLNELIHTVTQNMEEYDLGIALDNIYSFIWNEFCDWYIEMAKTRLYSDIKEEKVKVCYVLNKVLATSLKLLHPFMPFVSSEIYSSLVTDEKELMISNWPEEDNELCDGKSCEMIENLKTVISEIRNVRANMNVHPSKKAKLIFVTSEEKEKVLECKEFLNKLAFGSEVICQETDENIPKNAVSIVCKGGKVCIPFEDLVDLEEEKQRLSQEKTKLEAEVQRAEKMLSNPGFISKAPAEKIEEEKKKLEKYKEMLESVKERLANI